MCQHLLGSVGFLPLSDESVECVPQVATLVDGIKYIHDVYVIL